MVEVTLFLFQPCGVKLCSKSVSAVSMCINYCNVDHSSVLIIE